MEDFGTTTKKMDRAYNVFLKGEDLDLKICKPSVVWRLGNEKE